MRLEDFDKLKNFNYDNDFKQVGGNLSEMDFEVYRRLQSLRDSLPAGNYIQVLSANSGGHSSNSFHYKGMAIDAFIPLVNTRIDRVFELAIEAGFKGIGIYKNRAGVYSFHFDIRDSYTFWRGTKAGTQTSWNYDDLVKI